MNEDETLMKRSQAASFQTPRVRVLRFEFKSGEATIGADFLTKEVMIDDKLVTMQARFRV